MAVVEDFAKLATRVARLNELEIENIKAERWDGKLPETVMGDHVPIMMTVKCPGQ